MTIEEICIKLNSIDGKKEIAILAFGLKQVFTIDEIIDCTNNGVIIKISEVKTKPEVKKETKNGKRSRSTH